MQDNMYTNTQALKDRVNAKLEELKLAGREISKAELGNLSGVGRAVVSNYLNGKHVSASVQRIKELEEWLENWLAENGEPTGSILQNIDIPDAEEMPKQSIYKRENFESADFNGITGVCTLCQETQDLGIIIGRTGYGKTYTLKNYAKLPKVIHIECNETMNCKDIIRRIEQALGLPKGSGSIDERMGRLCAFFQTNKGYLLIMDEADKLLSKYTIKKIELIRSIADASSVGVVLAGEPALKSSLRAWDERFANRISLIYELKGLTPKEVQKYFNGYEVEEEALEELCVRACNKNTGCFRLLDRTLNNVLRILKTSDKNIITYDVLKEASSMMIL